MIKRMIGIAAKPFKKIKRDIISKKVLRANNDSGYDSSIIQNNTKWCVIGDSLSDETNHYATTRYFRYCARDLKMNNVVVNAVSGTGFKRGEDSNNCFYIRVNNIPKDAEIVTIMGSINDTRFIEPSEYGTLGEWDDAFHEGQNNSVCACINHTINLIQNRIPLVRLGIISAPPASGNQSPFSQPPAQLDLMSKALKEICSHRSIPFLDLYHCSNLRPWDENFRNIAMYDDIHPNDLGHKLIYPLIREFVKTL